MNYELNFSLFTIHFSLLLPCGAWSTTSATALLAWSTFGRRSLGILYGEVFFSSSFTSTLGVKMMRRTLMRLAFTSSRSSTAFERTPKRMVPSPGRGTEWPSVAHVRITSPAASQAALITPAEIPLWVAASAKTFFSAMGIYRSVVVQ